MSTITRLFRRSEGQDLIEYALLASLVSVLAVVVLNSVGVKVSTRLDNIGAAISATGAPGGAGAGAGATGGGTGSGGTSTGGGNTGGGNGNGGNGNGNGNKKT